MRRAAFVLLLLCPFGFAHAQDYIAGRENGRAVHDIGALMMASIAALPKQGAYAVGSIVRLRNYGRNCGSRTPREKAAA